MAIPKKKTSAASASTPPKHQGPVEMRWYFLRAISGQEKKVKMYIEREFEEMNLTKYMGQILIPTQKVYEMRNGKKRLKEQTLYPGYVLIEIELHDFLVPIIKDIPSVIGFLGGHKKGDPEPIPASEMRRILGVVDEMAEKGEMPANPFIKGERVKVIEGPFNGFSGTVDEVDDKKKFLKVIVKIFERNTPMELKYSQVEKEAM